MKKSPIIISIFGALLLVLLSSCGQETAETTPIRKDVTETVFAAGALEAEGMYNLTAQTNGYITQLNFDEGHIVEKGNVLAVIENNENIINTKMQQSIPLMMLRGPHTGSYTLVVHPSATVSMLVNWELISTTGPP